MYHLYDNGYAGSQDAQKHNTTQHTELFEPGNAFSFSFGFKAFRKRFHMIEQQCGTTAQQCLTRRSFNEQRT